MGPYELRYKITRLYADYISMFLDNRTKAEYDLMLLSLMSYTKMTRNRPLDNDRSVRWYFHHISMVFVEYEYYFDTEKLFFMLKRHYNHLQKFKNDEYPHKNITFFQYGSALEDWVELMERSAQCWQEMEEHE